jgi:hypothetical protein
MAWQVHDPLPGTAVLYQVMHSTPGGGPERDGFQTATNSPPPVIMACFKNLTDLDATAMHPLLTQVLAGGVTVTLWTHHTSYGPHRTTQQSQGHSTITWLSQESSQPQTSVTA